MKRKIKVFVSYAKSNKAAKQQFMAMLSDYAGADASGESCLTGHNDG